MYSFSSIEILNTVITISLINKNIKLNHFLILNFNFKLIILPREMN
jgi:hypothetical protein